MGHQYAGVAELADALDLGSSVFDVGVQVLSPAPKKIGESQFFYTLFWRYTRENKDNIYNSIINLISLYI
jgi:hypothetical protein